MNVFFASASRSSPFKSQISMAIRMMVSLEANDGLSYVGSTREQVVYLVVVDPDLGASIELPASLASPGNDQPVPI